MRKTLVDIVTGYAKEFEIAVEFTDNSATFVTDDGTIVLEESEEGIANLRRVEPLDETDDDQIMRLSKIRRHFSAHLKAALEEAKKAETETETKAEPPAKKKAGRPPKSEKTELPVEAEEAPKTRPAPRGTKAAEDAERAKKAKEKPIDPPDEPVEKPPVMAADEELPDIRPECDKGGRVLPEVYKLMKLRGEKVGLAVVEEDLRHLLLEGEYGSVEVLANGEIKSEVSGYIRVLNGQPAKEAPAPTAKSVPAKPEPAPSKPATGKRSIFDEIIEHFGPDLLEVFGETGTMKSQGMVALAKQCAEAGRKVYYLDTENNISPFDVEMLRNIGVNYHYTPVLTEIDDIFDKNIPAIKADVIIVDSVGMPVLRKFSAMSAHDRGSALLDIIKWLGILKEWTYLNKSIAFVTNQPQSEFGKSSSQEKGDHRMPFGDKSNFIPGALLLSKKLLDSPQGSKAAFQVFRLRSHAWGEKVFEVSVDKNGPVIKLVV